NGIDNGGAAEAAPRCAPAADFSLPADDHDHPHSLKPQTWHFMQPSANSSCEPQSGHAPESVSCMPPKTICSPPGAWYATGWAATGAVACPASDPGSSSCWMPCFSCI